MKRNSFERIECPIARAIEQVGDAWTLVIVRNAFLGVRCFADFEERLDIPPSTLARRLARLCEMGILTRERYRSTPPRDEYLLTPKGLELLPLLIALATWGGKWLCPKGTPIQAVDSATGLAIEARMIDGKTGREIVAGKVALGPGPSASAALEKSLTPPRLLGARPGENLEIRK